MHYWINTISGDHVDLGVQGGFTQAGHGKDSGLRKINFGDHIVFYSPKTKLVGGDPLQAFTALGRIVDKEPFQVEMTPDFHPWRRKVEFLKAKRVPIRPLIEDLSFIQNKQRWGFPFRRGLFQIEYEDFELIRNAMGVKVS